MFVKLVRHNLIIRVDDDSHIARLVRGDFDDQGWAEAEKALHVEVTEDEANDGRRVPDLRTTLVRPSRELAVSELNPYI